MRDSGCRIALLGWDEILLVSNGIQGKGIGDQVLVGVGIYLEGGRVCP
jgi:hypothetical protein